MLLNKHNKYDGKGKEKIVSSATQEFRKTVLFASLKQLHKNQPDYVPTSATLSKVFLEQGFALMTATASLGSIATRSLRRLNRYCTSAR